MIDTELLGASRRINDIDAPLDRALDEMEDAAEDRALSVAWARKALKIEPCCASALLVLAEYAPTAVERIALLKEVIGTYKRSVRAGQRDEIDSVWDSGAKPILAAVALLGDELAELGDIEGAKACYRAVIERDEDDRLEAGASLEALMAGETAFRA
ncbi:MAG: hypothetical protein JJ959_08085 [Nisaea sp.]|uniref:hypothetical protein n=1 Tax=Nisaea sp. TaxID=2024842 RepID=UPI001B2C1414|nr:hypothetical protein [Nisaea sp.]MBO6560480.1 hypothetical protein [Nisaea sp.]